ncbi:MAG: hypothetical protein Q4B18_02495 [Bacillota bacterium]|nr:hypothetical protein [Bacillota bacterium]
MAYDQSKAVELYLLKAENFSEESAPNQKKYYLDAAKWLEENQFESAYHMTQAMKNTEYYEGAGIAKTADDIELRIAAMEKVGYEDVAAVHRERKKKFDERGNEYAFAKEWLDDYDRVAFETEKYARRKEVFGKIFSAYFQMAGNPQSEHRKEAAEEMSAALGQLKNLGTSFDELAGEKVYRDLTMTTDEGMANFIDFVHGFAAMGYDDGEDMAEIREEQDNLAKWVNEHKAELVAIGEKEKWHCANCIAVPSEDPCGYDFIAMKEVKA